MSIITEFTVPAEAFALEETFEEVPNVTIEIERLATHSREWVMPFLWATDGDLDALESALRNDSSISELKVIDVTDDIGYFNVTWTEEIEEMIDQIVNKHGIVQEARAANGRWHLKLQFVDQETLKEFQEYFREQNYSLELERLYDGTAPKEREYDLTPPQREALVAALEMGYFSVPRDSQIGDIAEELEVSTNAVSQRLRRATGNLTRNVLTVSTGEAPAGGTKPRE
ncbi:helix-turn-helix domain-containing protein [Halostagnicola bangensis]